MNQQPKGQIATRVRSLLFEGLFGLWTTLFALGIPPLWIAGSPARPIRTATRLWARGTLGLLEHVVGLTYLKQGQVNLSKTPVLIVANHQSQWETLAFLVLFPDVTIIAKKELLKIPVVSWYLARSPMIIIDREAGSAALKLMLKQSQTAIEAGRSVLIFPEGKRMPPDAPVIFRRGVELLYSRLNVPALPVMVDSGRYWGKGSPFKRPGRIMVSVLPEIQPGLAPAEFATQAQSVIEAERLKVAGAA